MTLIVVSRQFGGGCPWGLMALLYSRGWCFFLNLVVEHLILSALTPLVSAALPLLVLVDGVVEFLHRERLHRVLMLLVLVLVFVFVRLRRSRAELLVELCEHVHNVLSVICVAASFILHVCDEHFLASGFDGCYVLESAGNCSRCLRCCVFFIRV